MKKIYFLASILILSVTVNAQKTYVGVSGNNWGFANGWSPAGVPSTTDDVIINSNVILYVNANAAAKSITMSGGAQLYINTGSTLSIPKPATGQDAILLNQGTKLTVDGSLVIGSDNAANLQTGIVIAGSTTPGTITSSGTISIDRCQNGIYFNTGGSITNSGSIKIGQQGAIGNTGINLANANLVNDGTILIDRIQGTTGAAIRTNTNAGVAGTRVITNNGTIRIGNIAALACNGITATDAAITNGSTATLSVDRAATAIQLTRGSLTNDNSLQIGNTATVTGNGLVTGNTTVNNTGTMIIRNTQGDGMQLSGGSFTNDGVGLYIGCNNSLSGGGGNCGGNGISMNNGCTFSNTSNNGWVEFGGVTGTAIQMQNLSSFTNSFYVFGGQYADVGSMVVMQNSTLINALSANFFAYGLSVDGINISNTSHVENRGTINIDFPVTGTNALSLNSSSDFKNYGTVSANGLFCIRGLYITGASLFENNSGGSATFSNLGATAQPAVSISGSGSKLINRATLVAGINNQTNHAVGVDLQGLIQNESTGLIRVPASLQNGFEIINAGQVNNAGTIELNNITNNPIHINSGGIINNDGMVKIGNGTVNTKTGLFIEGANTKFQNNAAGQVTVNRVAAAYNGVQVISGALFQNAGNVNWGTSSLAFQGAEALQATGGGDVNNTGNLELSDITNTGIHASTGSIIVNDGTVHIGSGAATGKTGILIEGSGTRFESNSTGQITLNRTGALYNGVQVITAAVFQNNGTMTWGSSSLAFPGAAALQVINNGVFDNQSAAALLQFVNCSGDAIVTDASNTGSSIFQSGIVQFGNITGRGIYNSNPSGVIINGGRLETLPSGKMDLEASIVNGAAGTLYNSNGTVTFGGPFSNAGTVTNGGTATNQSTFSNESGGFVYKSGVWTMNGTFTNKFNGWLQGTGVMQGLALVNNGDFVPNGGPGCMALDGFTSQPAGTINIDVNGRNTPCVQFDRVTIGGTINLTGSKLKVTFGGGFTGIIGDMITVVKSGSIVGTFSSTNLPAGWTVLYNAPAAGDITLSRAVVPLTLLDFNAQKAGEKARASWTTTNEINTDHFELQRSDDGTQFQKLASVPALNISGDHHYEFTDPLPLQGHNYYRLKMIDKDGQYTYSRIAQLDFGKAQTFISSVYPNPVKDIVNVAVTDAGSISLISQEGRTVLTKQFSARGVYQLDLSAFAAGIYFIKTGTGEVYKVVKQ